MEQAAPDRDPAVNRALDAAINSMRAADTDFAKFGAIRIGAKAITIVGGDQDAIDHLSNVAIDMHALPADDVQLALNQGIADGTKEIEERPIPNKGNGKAREDARHEREAIHSWDDPDWSLLEDRRGDLPSFPLDCLNARWQAWALQTAHGSGTTPAHVVVPLLGIASGLIGAARRVQVARPWIEPIAMWTALVGASGTGKTPGLDATKRALAQIETIRRPKVEEAKRAHEERADIAKIALRAWKKTRRGGNQERRAAPAQAQRRRRPRPVRGTSNLRV
jgi:hypothetical protein